MAAPLGPPPTIAVVFDAAEPVLVRRLMAAGEMPVLAGLAARGMACDVAGGAEVGSGSVWPTFATGRSVRDHAAHYIWRWDPGRMRLGRETGEGLVHWWRPVAESGRRVLTIDVPYLPLARTDGCAEVFEWGSHDRRLGSIATRPAALAAQIERDPGRHPFDDDPAPGHDRPSLRDLTGAARRARAGARMRGDLAARLIGERKPDLAVVVFAEMHHSSHLLWHTAQPDDPLFAGRRRDDLDPRALVDVFRAADAALGQILDASPRGARLAVFSLHGMRSAFGIPTVLRPLLAELGYAAAPRPSRIGPREAGRTAFAAAKRNAPEWARSAWRRSAPLALLNAVAGPTAMGAYDWERTRAFALPHDQHGWIRLNLAGREARGIVPAGHYAGTCDELCAALLAARTEDGRPIVRDVLRVCDEAGAAPPARLPDLVVHWADGAYDDPLRVAGSDIAARPDARRLTGRHTFTGFAVAAGLELPSGTIAGHDLHRVLAAT